MLDAWLPEVTIGLSEARWPKPELYLPAEARLHRQAIATLLPNQEWSFRTFAWSVRRVTVSSGTVSFLDWVDAVYFDASGSERLCVRTWIQPDSEEFQFGMDLVAEHLLAFLQEGGVAFAEASLKVANASSWGSMHSLSTDGARASFIVGCPRVTLALTGSNS